MLNLAATLFNGMQLVIKGQPADSAASRVFSANWKHLKTEMNEMLGAAIERGPGALAEAPLADALIASLMSDAVKLGDLRYVVTHDIYAAEVWKQISKDHFGPEEPDVAARARSIETAILEHQGVPPSLMGMFMGFEIRTMATLLGGLDLRNGVTMNGQRVSEQTVASVVAKMSDPYKKDPSGAWANLEKSGDRLVLRLTPPEKEVFSWVRTHPWHLPDPNSAQYAVSYGVVEADAGANYLSGDGAAKILGAYRGWKTGNATMDATADDGIASIVGKEVVGSDGERKIEGGSVGEWAKFFTRPMQLTRAMARRELRLETSAIHVKQQLAEPGGWLEQRRHELELKVGKGDENPFVYDASGSCLGLPYFDLPLTYPKDNRDPQAREPEVARSVREALEALTPKQRVQLDFHLELRAKLADLLRDSDVPALP